MHPNINFEFISFQDFSSLPTIYVFIESIENLNKPGLILLKATRNHC